MHRALILVLLLPSCGQPAQVSTPPAPQHPAVVAEPMPAPVPSASAAAEPEPPPKPRARAMRPQKTCETRTLEVEIGEKTVTMSWCQEPDAGVKP